MRVTDRLASASAEVKQTVNSYATAFRLGWDVSPGRMLSAIVPFVVAGLTPVAQMWIIKLFLDEITSTITTTHTQHQDNVHTLLWLLCAQFVLLVIRQVEASMSVNTREIFSDLVRQHVNLRILRKAARLDLAFFETPTFYDKLENARASVDRVAGAIQWFLMLIQAVVTLSSMIVVLVRFHWLAAVGAVAVSLPYAVGYCRYARLNWSVVTQRAPETRLVTYLCNLLTGRDAAKEIRVFGLADYLIDETWNVWRKFFTENVGLVLLRSRMMLGLGIVTAVGLAGGWGYVVLRALQGTISVGDVSLYFSAIGATINQLTILSTNIGYGYEGALFLQNLFDFLDLDPQSLEGSLLRGATWPKSEKRMISVSEAPEIEFRNVHFRYPGTNQMVLQGVTLGIDGGTTAALVGENGAGKSTLVKLLLRLYDPVEGQILLDGLDIRDYDVDYLRGLFSVVFQDFVRYELTARDNVGLGDVSQVDDMASVARAAERSAADQLIAKLAKGYDTVLGRTFEGSTDLSTGEWQKIALARGFMRDTPIVVLDEPTAALDARAEHDLYKRAGKLATGKTTLLISHRFSTTRMAHHILVLANGRIIEAGSHEALLCIGGTYAKLFGLQAERYRM